MSDQSHCRPGTDIAPGLFRRLGAILYDTMLVAGLVLMAIVPVIITLGAISGLDQIDTAGLRQNPFLLSICSPFPFCFSSASGSSPDRHSVCAHGASVLLTARVGMSVGGVLLCAILRPRSPGAHFGLGYLWILVDPEKRAWHDRSPEPG